MDDEISRVVVDDRATYEKVSNFISDFMPRVKDRIRMYRGKEPIYDTFGVETQVQSVTR